MRPENAGGLRVVLDTNVYISAFTYPERPLAQVWRHALRNRYQLLISPAIVREVARVLRDDFDWDEASLRRRLRLLTKVAAIITPRTALHVILMDPPDNRILECAVEGRANLIVSGDRHLLRLKGYRGIPIVRPIDLLRTLGAK
ncbi:MAG: putative toxin-antitoxin system toxin component, PIN family [Nitrospinae bacterium]|nr:putative toxin-antitoxin system toxin component, PIN family [Nitrospinota bacterium]